MFDDVYEEYQTTDYNTKIEEILKKKSDELDFQDPIDSETEFRAIESIRSYGCQIKMFLHDYIFAIMLVLIVTVYLMLQVRRCLNNRKTA